jgi:hypothetical protein
MRTVGVLEIYEFNDELIGELALGLDSIVQESREAKRPSALHGA